MTMLNLDSQNSLYYEYHAPKAGKPSFVFINPITGDVSLWNGHTVPALQALGFGTLVYNFRGQDKSTYADGTDLTDTLIITDLDRLIAEVKPERPILTGLSIGGLYAARAILSGTEAVGLVLINTLRKITPRIQWMNDASLRVMDVGGPNLMKDLYFQFITGEPFQVANRSEFLKDKPDYTPLDKSSGAYNLLTWMGKTDWDIAWSQLKLPTLVLSGLQDRVFFDAPIVDELFKSLPDGQRIDMPDAGHMLPAELPESFTKALIAFGNKI
ncbi:MAG: alpha/beta hydrolase [Burkholderiaceae bacterium]